MAGCKHHNMSCRTNRTRMRTLEQICVGRQSADTGNIFLQIVHTTQIDHTNRDYDNHIHDSHSYTNTDHHGNSHRYSGYDNYNHDSRPLPANGTQARLRGSKGRHIRTKITFDGACTCASSS